VDVSSGSRQSAIKLILDLTAFIGFLVVLDQRLTGNAIHEWLAVAVTAVVIVHLLLNWKWIVEITRRLFRKIPWRSRIHYILDWLLYIDLVLIMLSGLMISETVLPRLGIHLARSAFWSRLHSWLTDLIIFILGMHVALHWAWITNVVKQHIFRPIAGLRLRKNAHPKQESEA